MKYLVRNIWLITLLLSSCNFISNFSTTVSTSTSTKLEATLQIYSVALSYGTGYSLQFCSSDDRALYYVTKNLKFDKEDWENINYRMPAITKDLWDNFLQINAQSIHLPENLDIGCEYRLINDEDLANITSYENSPDIYYLSRIAFNSYQDHALAYRGYEDYDYCYSDLLYFEIIDGQWKVIDSELLIIC